MDIPYVVNQWWASVVSAKQKSAQYLGSLRERGYPDDSEQYNALALASAFDRDPEQAPWGGLPLPTIVVAEAYGDAMPKVFELWALEHGAAFYPLEKTVLTEDPDPRWWERVQDDWEALIGSERIDLLVDELKGLIRFLEQTTGRIFDETRFRRVMLLANEQAAFNAAARDLVARTTPAPISITDSIPAVMLPQWHRGTEWGRDAARTFFEEVEARVEQGEAAYPGERMRLMWVGRGLWFNLGFYQFFQERFGAVFVWSMYLAIAADGYIRRGADPLRTLAGRFAAFTEQLNAPPWNAAWFVKEAHHNQIDGVIHLAGGAQRGAYFVTRALEEAGFPVFQIDADNVDARNWNEEALKDNLSAFLEHRVAARAYARLAAARPAAT